MEDPDQNTLNAEKASVLADTSCPIDFSQLTPSQFGISHQSFTPSSNSNDTFHLAKLKARRRSNIGVRGSPETNSLIRYIALQRMKTPPTLKTPQMAKGSPFLPCVSSTLKQKMASFQSLIDVEEQEGCDLVPRHGPETGGCIKTRDDDLSDERRLDCWKENCPPPLSPTPSKRPRLGLLRDCAGKIRGDSTPILQHINVKEQKADKEQELQHVTPGQKASYDTVQGTHTFSFFQHPNLDSPINNKQDGSFELQSTGQPQPTNLPLFPLTVSSTLPSLKEMKPSVSAGAIDSPGNSTMKKKKVRFGTPLSPELFDKNLPPSTPLQKGASPIQKPTPGRGFELRSVLKTPQRSEPGNSLAQPDFNSSVSGASPMLSSACSRRVQSLVGEDVEMCGKITFPSLEEDDDCLLADSAGSWEARLLDQTLIDPLSEEVLLSEPCQSDPLEELQPQINDMPHPKVPVRSSSRTRKTGAQPKSESTLKAPAHSSSRKRKQTEESEPVKRSTRSAAKSAWGKMKQAKRQWGAKEVDRSLYGSREYASKLPTLSPITESLSFASRSPMPQQPVNEEEPCLSLFAEGNSDSITAALLPSGPPTSLGSPRTCCNSSPEACRDPPEAAVKSVTPGKRRAPGNAERCSDRPTLRSRVERRDSGVARGRGRNRRKNSVPVEDLLHTDMQHEPREGLPNELDYSQTTNLETTEVASSSHQEPGTSGNDTDNLPAGAPCTEYSRESCSCVDTPILDVDINSVSEEYAAQTLLVPSEAQSSARGRKSSVCMALQEEEEQPVLQLEQEASLALAPWQADFNSEDMFKPVATRGQRSVRRSLRNLNKTDCGDSGLAWLPRTSPVCSREVRRRALSRRLHTVPFPEETHN